MKSALPKVLHRAAGLPLIEHVLRAAASLAPRSIVVVVGHQAEQLEARARRNGWACAFAVQEPQLGTGHALLQAEPHWRAGAGTLVLLSGDVPLLGATTLRALVETHVRARRGRDGRDRDRRPPDGYGRIVREHGERLRASSRRRTRRPTERAIQEINSGIYAFDLDAAVRRAARASASTNAQGEYYLPDLVAIYRARGLVVETVTRRRRRRDPGHQQPHGAGGSEPQSCDDRRTTS